MQSPWEHDMPRILIAEDDRLALYAVATGLRQAGFETVEAESAEEAMTLCQEPLPDLALLDIKMGKLSGLDLGQWLHSQVNVPFLFLTAYNDAKTVDRAVQAGALGYLVKPLDVAQIIPSIRAALERAAEIKALRQTETQLCEALQNSREISTAVGLIMARQGLSAEAAFESLRVCARSNRVRIGELATRLIAGDPSVPFPDSSDH